MRAWFAQSDDYGFALVLILATIIVLATIGSAPAGQFVAVALSGGTLMFVLHTSRARPGVFRFAAAVVIGGIVISGIALLLGLGAWGSWISGLIGLLLAFVAPVAIARRLIMQGTISVKTVLGALCFYLLIGLFFNFLYGAVAELGSGPFFGQGTDGTPATACTSASSPRPRSATATTPRRASSGAPWPCSRRWSASSTW